MITIEQIDEFRKRTNSSYEDAKYFLEKNNGDILDAIIEFERTKSAGYKHGTKNQKEDFSKKAVELIQKGFDVRVVIHDEGSTLFSFPVILLIILIPVGLMVVLAFALLAIIGYKVKIEEVKSKSVNVKYIFQGIHEKSQKVKHSKEEEKKYRNNMNQNSNNYQKSDKGQEAHSNKADNTETHTNAGPENKTNSNKKNSTNQNANEGNNYYVPVPVENNITSNTGASDTQFQEDDHDEDGFSEYTVE